MCNNRESHDVGGSLCSWCCDPFFSCLRRFDWWSLSEENFLDMNWKYFIVHFSSFHHRRKKHFLVCTNIITIPPRFPPCYPSHFPHPSCCRLPISPSFWAVPEIVVVCSLVPSLCRMLDVCQSLFRPLKWFFVSRSLCEFSLRWPITPTRFN